MLSARSLGIYPVGLLALLVGACSGGDAEGAGGTAGAAASAGGDVITYRFVTVAYVGEPTGVPVEGVTICEETTHRCATSDASGQVALDVPANQAVFFTSEKEGYGGSIEADISDENAGPINGFPDQWFMWTHAQLEAIAAQLQTNYPWPQGMVGLLRWRPIGGVTFEAVGSSVDAVGERFYYDGASGEYSLELEATTTFFNAFALPLAQGGFIDVAPGVHEFELGGTAGDCDRTGWAWPGSAPNRIRLPVRTGFMTYAGLICDE